MDVPGGLAEAHFSCSRVNCSRICRCSKKESGVSRTRRKPPQTVQTRRQVVSVRSSGTHSELGGDGVNLSGVMREGLPAPPPARDRDHLRRNAASRRAYILRVDGAGLPRVHFGKPGPESLARQRSHVQTRSHSAPFWSQWRNASATPPQGRCCLLSPVGTIALVLSVGRLKA
jgi:hypothetical protein